MRELINDPFYELINTYDQCVIDYWIVEDDTPHQGYHSHHDAILFVMRQLDERYIQFQIEKAKAEPINPVAFFHVPESRKKENEDDLPYWYAFLNPPEGSDYGIEDFNKINNILFPNGTSFLEVYEWTTDWSNYFDAGHEWWGAACWSTYDSSLNRYVIIMASATY